MLKFLKALFGRADSSAQQPGSQTVALAELEIWLKQLRAPAHTQLVEQLAASRSRVDQHIAAAREKITVLQNAQLLNPDIPERAKDFMIGNREEYCRRVAQYVDALALPTAAEAMPQFFSQFADSTQQLTKGILRPFHVLQEFFANETKEIASALAQIEQEVIAMRELHAQSRLDSDAALRAEMQTLKIRQQQLQGIKSERSALEQQQAEQAKSIAALNAEEERLLKDATRQQLLQKVQQAHLAVQAQEQKLRDLFLNIEPALRKFHRMGTRHVKLTERYLRNPVAALAEDLHLEILDIITDIQRLMTFDRIALGEQKGAVLHSFEQFTKDTLGHWLREYGQCTKGEKEAQAAVENCPASQTLGRIQRLRDDTRRNLQLTEARLMNFVKDAEKINLAALVAALEANIKTQTGSAVSIVL